MCLLIYVFNFFIRNELIAAAAGVKYVILEEFLCNSALINVHFSHNVNNNVPNVSEAVVENSFLAGKSWDLHFSLLFKNASEGLWSIKVKLDVAPMSNLAPCNWNTGLSAPLVSSCLSVGAGKDTSFPQRPWWTFNLENRPVSPYSCCSSRVLVKCTMAVAAPDIICVPLCGMGSWVCTVIFLTCPLQ